MNGDQRTLRQHIEQRLGETQDLIKKGSFADAIGRVRDAKLVDVRNIYLIALEKQLEKLVDEANTSPLTPERTAEAMTSLTGIINHAIKDATHRDRPLGEPTTSTEQRNGGSVAETEKKKALEKLKSQYFQRADEYVAKGDYLRAQEEVRRIKILDPNDRAAKELEEKIAQLSSVTVEKSEAAVAKEPAPAPEDHKPQKVAEPPRRQKSEARGGGAKVVVIILLLIAVVAVIYIVTQKGPEPDSQTAMTEQRPPVQSTSPAVLPDPSSQPEQPETTLLATEDSRLQTTRTIPERAVLPQREQPRDTRPPAQEPPARETRNQRNQPVAQPNQRTDEPATRPATTERSAEQPPTTPAPAPPAVVTNPPATIPAQPATETGAGAGTSTFLPLEVDPKVVSLRTPEYPQIAMRMNIWGDVIVRVLVDAAGVPKSAVIHRSDHEVLNAAAIDAAMKSRYSPGRNAQGPTEAHTLVRFTFSLRR